ncbi:hypothetical protein D3C72_2010230 [compost metagenome]
MRTLPLSGAISPISVRPSVDLPEPDSPTSPSVSPWRISSEMSRSASTRRPPVAKVLHRFFTTISGCAAAASSLPCGLCGTAAMSWRV